MQPRAEIRKIPDTDRYFDVDLGESLGDYHFRFPSYGKAARMVGLLQGLEEGDGLEKLIGLLDVAGYCIGLCWYNRGYDLDAGPPPRSLDGEEWTIYGDAVVDELQEHGVKLPGIMALVNALIEQLGSRLAEVEEAKAEAGN